MAERSRSVRTTLDLDPTTHRDLKRFALEEGDNAHIADVLRAMITLLFERPELSVAVRDRLYQQRRHIQKTADGDS